MRSVPLLLLALIACGASAAPIAPSDCPLATIGLETTDLSAVSRKQWKLPNATYGALVIEVMPKSPAEAAGIAVGDAIVKVDATRVQGYCDFIDAIGATSCAKPFPIEFFRGAKRLTHTVQPVSAAEFYDAACLAGQATGCYRHGWLAAGGSGGVTQDDEFAKKMLRDACGKGSAAACDYLAHAYLTADSDADEARKLYERACKDGNGTACVDFAFLYATGTGGVARDDAKATPLFVKGCDLGDPSGCYNVGLMYEYGRGVKADFGVAYAAYVEGCEGGFPKSCENLALLYENGRGVPQSHERAVALYRRACTDGPGGEADSEGCVNLAQAIDDPKESVRLLAMVCDRKPDSSEVDSGSQIARACALLGVAYLDGRGVSADVDRAIELSESACDAGSMMGCYNLGTIYANGEKVPRNDEKAAEYYRRGCDGDDADSCFELGRLTEDEKEAAALYEKACDGGSPKGCTNLGEAYGRGAGVPQDAAKAVALFAKACEAEQAEACYNLANHYAEGNGVAADAKRAAELYDRACKGGLDAGCEKAKAKN